MPTRIKGGGFWSVTEEYEKANLCKCGHAMKWHMNIEDDYSECFYFLEGACECDAFYPATEEGAV